MKSVLSELQAQAYHLDVRLIRLIFSIASLVFMIILNSPEDGTGGGR